MRHLGDDLGKGRDCGSIPKEEGTESCASPCAALAVPNCGSIPKEEGTESASSRSVVMA